MNSNGTWNAGENILLRGVWRKRLWLAAPVTVVQDSPNLIAVYWKANTPSKIPAQRITYKELLSNEQIHLVDSKWVTTDVLMLSTPGSAHGILVMWESGHVKFNCWYVNLQEPLRRTPMGLDTMDQLLDIVIEPDLSSWHWKDENEFADKIIRSGVDTVILSIDGDEHSHEFLRGRGNFAKTVSTLKRFCESGKINLRINTLLYKKTKDKIKFIADLADKHNVSAINFIPIRLFGRANKFSSQAISKQDFYDIVTEITLQRKTHKVYLQTYYDILDNGTEECTRSILNKKTCAAGVESAVISPKGLVYGCASSPAGDDSTGESRIFIAGDLRLDSFEKIWNDSTRWRAYRDMSMNKCETCLKCRYYVNRCFGNCFANSFSIRGKLNDPDPYCFAELLEEKWSTT